MRKICALLGGALLLVAGNCFGQDLAADVLRSFPKLKTELAALSENGRTAFKKALIACSLYADDYDNATYEMNCKAASKFFTVEFSNERNALSNVLSLAASATGMSAALNKAAIMTGQVSPTIGNPDGKAYITALEEAYRETNLRTATVTTAPMRPAAPNAAGQILIPLQRQGGTFVVPVLINKKIPLNFVVDSGAADVSIPSDVVLTLIRTGTLQDTDFIGTQKYKLADGSIAPAATFRIRSLTVNNVEIGNVKASVAPVAGELLLGQSFLSRFKSWSIDNARQALVLTQ